MPKTYVVKASWGATSKMLRIDARDATVALRKAKKSRLSHGAKQFSLMEELDAEKGERRQEG